MAIRFFRRRSLDQPVFVVSAPRSGSTWLKQSLNAHRQIHCTENRLFGPHFDVVLDGPQKIPRLRITTDAYVDSLFKSITTDTFGISPQQAKRTFTRNIANAILKTEKTLSKRSIIVDKFTPYVGTALAAVQELAETFPKAKFIHLVRDGRDVATSGVFHWLTKSIEGEEENPNVRKRSEIYVHGSPTESLERFFTDTEIDEWARTWSEPNAAMAELGQNRDVLVVRYEDMLKDHAGQLQRLFRFLSADSSPETIAHCVEGSSFQKMSGGRKPGQAVHTAHVRKGVAGDWRNYFCQKDGKQFERIAGDELQHANYEQDSNWPRKLPKTLDIRAEKAA